MGELAEVQEFATKGWWFMHRLKEKMKLAAAEVASLQKRHCIFYSKKCTLNLELPSCLWSFFSKT